MATISTRRRRFILLVVLCCMTFFLFSWYIKGGDKQGKNGNFLPEIVDVSITFSNEVELDSKPLKNEKEAIQNFFNNNVELITEETNSILSNIPENALSERPKQIISNGNDILLERFKQSSKNSLANMLSYKSGVIFNPELETFGPTEDGNSQYIQELETDTTPLSAVTMVYNTDQELDIELQSGSINSELSITKSPTHPPDYDNSKGSMELHTVKIHNPTTTKEIRHFPKPKKNPALIIDTPGCKIPKMDPFDPSVKGLIKIHDEDLCADKPPLFMTPEPNGIIHLNVSVLKQHYNATPDDMQCWYQAILRKHEEPENIAENDYETTKVKELKFDVPLEHEYIAVRCYFRDDRVFEQYLPLVKLKKEVEEEKKKIKPHSPLNVILIGIDSVSKLNFMRHFRKTGAFLKNKMKPFDMKGYTKVGDNTFPNLVPLLTGHFADHYWNESIKETFFFDQVDFIWKDYAKHGYRTFFAEDSPYSGTFNYFKRGFYDPPTDYYYRPLALAIMQSKLRKDNLYTTCLNSELETELMYNYLKNFVKTMGDNPYFAFVMISALTHDFLNSASYADPPTVRILDALDKNGALNNSALVMFSDHGLRFGEITQTYIGKFEERMPFMYINFPQWFLDQHPEIERNLYINQDRLITLFDVHATMKHLLHLNGDPMEQSDDIGLSLLNEIPESRTCDDAWIFMHWCPCNSFDPVAVDDPAVVNVSQAMIGHINELLQPHADVCATLEIDEITDARLGLPNIVVLKFIRTENALENPNIILGEEPPRLGDYLISLTAKPGGAIFEGTIRYDAKNAESKVMGLSRLNMYGNQSKCINSPKLKLYCFCK